MEERKQISDLDGIELLQVVNHKSKFPEHYHDTFCISLIQDGIEAIKMGDNTLFTEKGNISINNPLEIHSNPIIDNTFGNSFTTIYLSPDLVDSILQKKGVHFQHQQKIQASQIENFLEIKEHIESGNIELLERNLSNLLIGFKIQSKPIIEEVNYASRKWSNLKLFIESHLEEKINLDLLAKFMDMDKFNFAKQFRLKFGLSPINYVLMKKIFKAKTLISKETNFTQLAYQLDFADQAHFSKFFKRFIGLSPRAYKQQL